jgi:hypothetical protein
MCEASKVTQDWVVKGCHIHIGAVDIGVFPNHKRGLGFKSVFAVTAKNGEAVAGALKLAEECLLDPDVRRSWVGSLRRATRFMMSVEGVLSELARGRMLEFKFLIIALERHTG